MDFLKMAPIVDLLLFLFGIFWVDIAAFLQKRIAKCNSKLFSFFYGSAYICTFDTYQEIRDTKRPD